MRTEQWLHPTEVYSSKFRLIYCSGSFDESAALTGHFVLFFRSWQIITGNYIPNISPQVINSLCLAGRRHVRLIGFLAPPWSHLHTCSSCEKITFVSSRWQYLPVAYSKENTFPRLFIWFFEMSPRGYFCVCGFLVCGAVEPSGAPL